MEHKEHFHGSDLEKIEALYGIKKESIISFSANVNPLGLSSKLKEGLADNLDALTRYPDREYSALRKAIASYVNSSHENILVGNGSTELISLFGKVTHPKHAMIVGPTYSEYEHEISIAGGTSDYYECKESENFALNVEALEKALPADCDLLVLCNPNNPTSQVIKREAVRTLVSYCKDRNITVIIDETYMEFTENYEEITAIALVEDYVNLVVLRGVSKFFAAPGLRLGYAVTSNRELIAKINSLQYPWSINSLAEVAGQYMFSDVRYIKDTKKFMYEERKRVYARLLQIPNLKVYKPEANFVLIKIVGSDKTAQDLFDAAILEHFMIRDCSSFTFLDETFFRFCFMNCDDNDKLLDLIEKTFS